MSKKPDFQPIAIIGMASIFPGSQHVHDFWRDIVQAKDLISEVPPSHWLLEDYYDPDQKVPDKTYCKRGSFISNVDFKPLEYGIPPNNVPQTDSAQLLSLVVAKQLLIDAFGLDYDQTADLKQACVILGATSAQELALQSAGRLQLPIFRKALRELGISQVIEDEVCQRVSANYTPWTENTFPGLLGNVISGRIANRFNFGGTNCVADAACASSMAALSMAVDELQLGRANLAITGGSDTLNDIFMYICFSKTPALSFTGDCRPFSSNADGTLLGEGIGFIALKHLAEAERDGNTIYAVIRGIGSSSDGRAKSVYAPVPQGQSQAILRSLAAADISPDSIELIEGHGTATAAGDMAELAGLQHAFAAAKQDKAFCALGSVKSQIGHTKAAAGAASLIKTVMALRHKTLPPTIKVEQPNAGLGKPFYLNTKTRPWIRTPDHPRRAGVSSFGFGGTNFHVILEEYTGTGKLAPRVRNFPSELFLLSATSLAELAQAAEELQHKITAESFTYWSKKSQQEFAVQQPVRLAIVAKDAAALQDKLQQINRQSDLSNLPKGCYGTVNRQPGKLAFLFPGQGSQYLNMGADLLLGLDDAQEIWAEMDAIAIDNADKLHEIVFPAPVFSAEEEQTQHAQLAQTQWTQPALAVTSLMQLHLLKSLGIQADCYAGHSFGELVALYAAGVYDATTLVKLARARGELMAEAGKIPGAMTAVIYPDVAALLAQITAAQFAVVAANYNSPQQTVFSGSEVAIAELEKNLQQEKVSFHRLPVSSAFHSPIIAEAKPRFLAYLQDIQFQPPVKPVYSNVSAQVYPQDAQQIKAQLSEQLVNPVQFVQEINAMYAAGVRTFVEVGPQRILSNFVEKILAGKDVTVIATDSKQEHGMTSLWQALAQLAVNGVNIDFSALWQDYAEPEAPRPKTEQSFSLAINGTSYAKPYPPAGGFSELPKPHINVYADVISLEKNVPKRKEVMTDHEDKNKQGSPAADHAEDRIMQILNLYQKLQDEVGKAHREYQELAEKSHLAYLEEAQHALEGIRQLAIGLEQQHPALSSIAAKPVPAATEAKPFKLPPLAEPEKPPVPPVVEPVQVQKMAPPPAVAPIPVPVAAPAAKPTAAIDPAMQAIILEIAAEKTGYPQDTITMDMDLEADLGIDSIKRVEILSAMQNKLPNLPEFNPTELAALHTFGEIADYIKKQQEG